MNYSLICKYNKKSKKFSWFESKIDILSADENWKEVINYNDNKSKRGYVLSGINACKIFINDFKKAEMDGNSSVIDSFISFYSFKKHIKEVIIYLVNGYIVTSPSVCKKYIQLWDNCYELSQRIYPDYFAIANAFEELHNEETMLLLKMCELRKTDVSKIDGGE